MHVMAPRPPSPLRPRVPLSSRLRRWLSWAWRDFLPISGWVASRRGERLRKRASGRRPEVARLRPEYDPFEDRSFMGLDLFSALQVALVGTGVALLAEVFRQSANGAIVPAPVPPGGPPRAAEAPPGDGVPFTAVAWGGGAGTEGAWGSQAEARPSVPDELLTQLALAETATLGGSPGSPDGDPGLGDLSSSDAGHGGGGGGGGVSPPAQSASGGGGSASGSAGGASGGGSSGPAGAPAGGMGIDPAMLTPTGSPAAHSSTLASSVAHGTGAGAIAANALPGATTGGTGTTAPKRSFAGIAQDYGHLPLPFEPNLGQSDPRVRYLSHGPGFSFFVTADGAATFSLPRPGQAAGTAATRDVLRLSLDGANPAPRPVPEGQQAGYSNYFSGGAGATSVTNVPQYGQLLEEDVYPGIDMVWHSSPDRMLEYDFVVSPGADPAAIRLHIDGATGLSTDAQGNVLIQTAGGTLLQRAPALSQPGPGGAAQPVAGVAALLAGGDLGFSPGAYDRTRPLTIDPVIQYSSYLGGSGDDKAYAVAADGAGDVFVAGTTASTNFPTSVGGYQTTNPGQSLFVTKLNAAGNAYVYSTYLSGVSVGVGPALYGIAVDAAGDAYVAGATSASNFPTTSGAYQTALIGTGNNAFLSKLSATGDALLYSTYFGVGGTTGAGVAVDPEGQAYLTGSTPASDGGGHNFPTTGGAYQTSAGAGTHAFVTAFNTTGTGLLYSTFLAGSGTDNGYGIAVGRTGAAYVTGSTTSSDFPTTSGAFDTTAPGLGSAAAFVTKLNPAGSALSYSTYLKASQGNAVAVDAAGDAFVTGSVGSGASLNFPTTSGAFQTSFSGGNTDAFASEFNPGGGALLYSTYLGAGGDDVGNGIAVDPSGYAVVTGSTTSGGLLGGSFPTTSGALQSGYGGSTDGFVTRVASDGKSLSYSSYLGGSGTDVGTAAAVDAFGNGYVVGYTNSTNFPTVSPTQGSSGGGYDAWVVKAAPLPAAPVFTSVTGGVSFPAGVVTSSQNLTISGTSTASATVTVSRADLGVLGTATANGSGSWSYNYTGTTLAEGSYAFTATQATGGATSNPSPAYVVTVDLTAPAVTLTAPSSTSSYAPAVTVTATDLNGLPDGTSVTVQQQSGGVWSTIATGTLTGGAAAITLPSFGATGTYPLRAQVSDRAGNQGTSATANVTVTSATGWSMTAQVLAADPLTGDALDQLGDARRSLPLDLDQGGGGMSGGAALVYHSDSVAQQPIVQATLLSANNASLPATVSAVLTWNGTAGATLTYSTSGLSKGDPLVIAAQVPSAVTTTSDYSWSLTVIVPGQPNLTASGTTYVVAQDSSVFGAGWSFAPVDQLFSVTNRVLRAYGTGGWRYYASAGGGSFTSPAGDNGTLSQTGGTYTYSTPDGQVWTFNSSGYETGWASPDGQSLLTFTYNGSNNLATMQAIDGTTTTFNYSGGKVSSIVTGNGRTTTLAYSGSNLTQVTNPDGGAHTFSYDANHRVTGETFANLNNEWAYKNGALATITWGSATSPSTTAVVLAAVQGLSAAVRAAVAQQTDAASDVAQWQLDAQGRPTQETAPNGGVTTWARDGNGYVTATTDPLGRTTSHALDGAGYVTQQTNPDGTTEGFAYQASYPTAFHALTSFTDERNNTTTYAYDSQGHRTSTTDALTDRTTATYQSNGLLQTVTDPRGDKTTFSYDALRRLTATTDALNEVTTIGYDANGFAQTTTDPLGRVSTMIHDVMGRQTGTIDALGDRTTVTYNAAGVKLTSTDALGRQTSTVYDTYNRGLVIEAIAAVGTQAQADTLTSYDSAGRVTQTRDADGWVSTFAYDRAGNQVQSNDALGGANPSAYDLAGQPTANRNSLGSQASSTYNARGWVTTSTDALGEVTTMAYDGAGHQTSATDPLAHTATTLYDALNRVTTAIDALGNRVTTTYDAAGNVSTVTDARGTVTSYAYDALNRRTMTTEAVATGLQRTTTVAYDKAGNVTSAADALGDVTTYAYDALNRQTAVTDPLGHTGTTTFDAVGNVATTKDALGNVTSYAYDALNRQTAVTDPLGHTGTMLYDAAGNQVESIDALGDVSQSDYDALGRLTAGVDPNGKITRYGYDAGGAPGKPDGPRRQHDQVGLQRAGPAGQAARPVRQPDDHGLRRCEQNDERDRSARPRDDLCL
jgi:YD repeat-containing protein